jgi:hypothetical protein
MSAVDPVKRICLFPSLTLLKKALFLNAFSNRAAAPLGADSSGILVDMRINANRKPGQEPFCPGIR